MTTTITKRRRFNKTTGSMTSCTESQVPMDANPILLKRDKPETVACLVELTKEDVIKFLDDYNNSPINTRKGAVKDYADAMNNGEILRGSPVHPIMLDVRGNLVSGQEMLLAHATRVESDTWVYWVIYDTTPTDFWLRESAKPTLTASVAIAADCSYYTAQRLRETFRFDGCTLYTVYDTDALSRLGKSAEDSLHRRTLTQLSGDFFAEVHHINRLIDRNMNNEFIQWVTRGLYTYAYCYVANRSNGLIGIGDVDPSDFDYSVADEFIQMLSNIRDDLSKHYPTFGEEAVEQLKKELLHMISICKKLDGLAVSNTPVVNAQMSAVIARFLKKSFNNQDSGELVISDRINRLLTVGR